MNPLKAFRTIGLIAGIALLTIQPANAGFVDFIIRGAPTINHLADPASSIEFIIDSGGQKAGLGSSDIDGMALGNITALNIHRIDDRTRFTPGSGPYVAPYFNIWITNGAGKFAVVANEPSNPAFFSLYNDGYQLSFSDLSDKVAKIYEYDTGDAAWLPNAGVGTFTFADFAGYLIQAPTAAELTAGWTGLGTGAPRELGTNQAYGVTWVFGDTLANYVSGAVGGGYIVNNALVRASEPGTLAIFALGLLGLGLARRRKAA
jgi:hypothetical protein